MRIARRAQANAQRRRYPFATHAQSIDWQVQGITSQLVNLSAETRLTQGRGHSTDSYDALLWDRHRNRPVAVETLLDRTALSARFCTAYPEALSNNAAPPEGDPRWTCPSLDGRPIAAADTDGNGQFDTLRVLMAVNYFVAHGYSVDPPIEAGDIARLPNSYRPAFEIPGERRPPTSE